MAAAAKSTTMTAEHHKLSPASLLKDALLTGILAFVIFGPIIGLKAHAEQGGLVLNQRWGLAISLAVMTALGRLALQYFWWNRTVPEIAKTTPVRSSQATEFWRVAKLMAPYALLLLAIVLPLTPLGSRRFVDIGTHMLIYIMLGWGLNVVVGLAGLLDLGYVAFFAVGAYSYALLSTVYFPLWFPEWLLPFSFWIALPMAGILAALWGVILGFPVLRLRGDYLAIVTLAFGEIIRIVLENWAVFTGGPNGISGIPRPTLFGIPFTDTPDGFAALFGLEFKSLHRILFLYYLILALALITNFVTMRLRKLPVGRAWEALREDEIACRSLGINTTNTKLTAFAIGAMFAGFAGSFFATRQSFVSPESFVFMESAIILAIVVLGGLGSQIGVVIATLVIMGAFEVFREFGTVGQYISDFVHLVLPETVTSAVYGVAVLIFGILPKFLQDLFAGGVDAVQYRMLAVGIAMVLMMRWRPRGLITRREPSIFLKEKKMVSGDLVAEGHG